MSLPYLVEIKNFWKTFSLLNRLCTALIGMDVCVYTAMKRKRPWVGRVTKVKDRETFEINWYEKDTTS